MTDWGFGEDRLPPEPLALFASWFERAERESGLENFNAFVLSTVADDGGPDGRVLLLKGFDESGFVFYTNKRSPKGRALGQRPRAALTFHWDSLGRQVRVRGTTVPVSDAEADAYFASRPRGSQLGAWASKQSQPLSSRAELEEAVRAAEARFGPGPVPRPPEWGGYRLEPSSLEFWQAGEFRLHDRVRYDRAAEGWRVVRLYP